MNLYIVGATGLVGRKLIEILNDSNLEFEEMCLFSSKRSAGERIKYKDKYLVVKSEINEIKPKNGVVILCVDKSISKVFYFFFISFCSHFSNSSPVFFFHSLNSKVQKVLFYHMEVFSNNDFSNLKKD